MSPETRDKFQHRLGHLALSDRYERLNDAAHGLERCHLIPFFGLVQHGHRCYSPRFCLSYPVRLKIHLQECNLEATIVSLLSLPSSSSTCPTCSRATFGLLRVAVGQPQASNKLLQLLQCLQSGVPVMCTGGFRLPGRRLPCRCQGVIGYPSQV